MFKKREFFLVIKQTILSLLMNFFKLHNNTSNLVNLKFDVFFIKLILKK